MEQIKIEEVNRSKIERSYQNMGMQIFKDQIFKHLTFEIGLFNRKSVEMDYLCLLKNNVEIGNGILVYKDKRKHFEFCYEKQLLANPNSCLLKNCYIDRRFRGLGYFRLMLSSFESKAIKHNKSKIILAVNKNNLNSISIFRHLGFVPVKNIYQEDECFVAMEKDLTLI